MAKQRRKSASRSKNTNAKSSTRLRLECLERRSLLSAIGWPLAPIVAPPPQPAVLAADYQAGPQHLAQAAVPKASAVLIANPAIAPLQLSPDAGDAPHEPLAAAGRLDDRTPAGDSRRADALTSTPSVLPDSTTDVPKSLADFGSEVPIEILPDTSHVIAVDPTNRQADPATTLDNDAGSVSPGTGESITAGFSLARNGADGAPPASGYPTPASIIGTDADGSESASAIIHPGPPLMLSGELAPLTVDPALWMHGMMQFQTIIDETIIITWGPEGFRGPASRDPPPVTNSNVDNEVPVSVESLPPPVVKSRSPDGPGINDASRSGDPTSAVLEASGSAPSGPAYPLATIAASWETATANSMEGRFIVLDDSSATTPQPDGARSLYAGLRAVEGADLDQGIWLSDILPNPARTGRFQQ